MFSLRKTPSLPLLLLLSGCGTPPSGADSATGDATSDAASDGAVAPPRYQPSIARCTASDNLLALREAPGRVTCVAVGATAAAATGDWPDTSAAMLPAPVVYVRPLASAGGDGTQARPFATLAEALRSNPAAVVLAKGEHTLDATATLSRAVTLFGAGPELGTTLTGPRGLSLLTVSGAGVAVTLRNLALRYAAAGTHASGTAAVRATAGASLTLDQVTLRDAFNGLYLTSAQLTARNLSVRGSLRNGLVLEQGSWASLTSSLVRDGHAEAGATSLAYGIQSVDSHLHLDHVLVHENEGWGVWIYGQRPAAGGVARCGPEVPAPAGTGDFDCLQLSAITCNGIVGLRVEGGSTLAASSSAPRVAGQRLQLSGTRAVGSMPGGDGLFLTRGARLELDLDLTGDASQGLGTEVVGNARAGVLVEGRFNDSRGAFLAAQLQVRGALVGSNLGPGLFVQSGGQASEVSYNLLDDNVGLGLAATSTSLLGSITCNGITNTRLGSLSFGAAAISLGDGLSLATGAPTMVLSGNRLSGNARFGGLLVDVQSGRVTGNTGADNGFGLGAYNVQGSVLDATNNIQGRSTPPAARPGFADNAIGSP